MAPDIAPPFPVAPPTADVAPFTMDDEVANYLQLPPPGDPEKVARWYLEWSDANARHALDQCSMCHASIEQDEIAFKGRQRAPGKDISRLDDELEFEEHKNQVVIGTAVMAKNVSRSGRTYRVQAINGETQSRADATQAVMDSQLDDTDWEKEINKTILRFNKHDIAGMKLICDFSEVIEPRRYEIHADMADQHMAEMDSQLKPYTMLGPADQKEPDGPFSTVLFETPEVRNKMFIGGEAMEMRNIAFADPKRPSSQDQPSIHEFHIFTEDELEDNTMFRVDWDKIGQPNAENRHHPDTVNGVAIATGSGETAPNFRQWEVIESHAQTPWLRAMRQNKFTAADLYEFNKTYRGKKGDIADFYLPQKWIGWHIEKKCLLKIDPTYHPDKKAHVYYTSSYIPGDSELIGQGMQRQVLPMSRGMNQFGNQALKNTKMRGGRSAFLDANSSVDRTQYMQARDKEDSIIDVEFPQGRSLKDVLVFLSEIVPDTFDSNMKGLSLCRTMAQTQGVPSIIQGMGQADTATQDSMNNERGQEKIDYPFGRLVTEVFVPILESVRELVFKHFDGPRMISIAGEDGVSLSRYQVITRGQITNRFKIIPMASFDFMNRQAKAGMILQGLNIISRVATFEILMKNWALFLEYSGEDRQRINELTDNVGKGTNAEEEIQVMLYNPDERMQDRIRIDDNPYERMMAASRALQDPQKHQQLFANPNFLEWLQKVLDMVQYQNAVAAGVIPSMAGGTPEFKGPANQPNPSPPNTPEGQTRQGAQHRSAPDQGGNTTGMTGRAALPMPMNGGVPQFG